MLNSAPASVTLSRSVTLRVVVHPLCKAEDNSCSFLVKLSTSVMLCSPSTKVSNPGINVETFPDVFLSPSLSITQCNYTS